MKLRNLVADFLRWYVRHTFPHPGRGVAGRLAYRLDRQLVEHYLTPDVKVLICTADNEDQSLWDHSGDLSDFLLIRKYLKPGMNVIDAGAHLGVFSLVAAKAVAPDGKVFAFEPVPKFAAKVRRNALANGLTNVEVIELGLSDTQGTAICFDYASGTSLFRKQDAKPSTKWEVRLTTLDTWAEQSEITSIDLIKIDVEGAEIPMLRGAEKLIRLNKPVLLVEMNPANQSLGGHSCEELFESLVKLGYRSILVRAGELFPCDRYYSPEKANEFVRDPYKERNRYDNYLFVWPGDQRFQGLA
jgi:FkbM family methyltransferase